MHGFGERGDSGQTSEVVVRWGLAEDEEEISTLLRLNGLPSRIATGEPYVVAEEDGEVVAALGYTTGSKRLALGPPVADPWRGERRLAVSLYDGAKRLARELGVTEVRARTMRWGRAYPREAGYRRSTGDWRWKARAARERSSRRTKAQ